MAYRRLLLPACTLCTKPRRTISLLQERGAAPLVAAVRHCFSVAIRSAHRLPSAAAYAGAGLRAPDARVLRYSFPGALLLQPFSVCLTLYSCFWRLLANQPLHAPAAQHTCHASFLDTAGEPDALQTPEVPCCSSPSFDATATHEMTLPAGHSILPLLQEG